MENIGDFSFMVPGKKPSPRLPDSTTGLVSIIFSTFFSSRYSQASPTATAVLPEPAGPVQNVTSDSAIDRIYSS